MTAWTYKKEGDIMLNCNNIEELKEIYEQLTPLNKLKADKKLIELLDEEGKLTAGQLIDFAKEYQFKSSELSLSYEELAFFGDFFENYGTKYGVIDEFHENGIC